MKYLIWASNHDRFRTKTGWVKNYLELREGEIMLSFNTRGEADKFIIRNKFINCQSYGISKDHEFYPYC